VLLPKASTVSMTARDAVRAFKRCAAMVDAGFEVTITRRGRNPLKLVRAEPKAAPADHELLVQNALAVRSAKPFKGRFRRSQAHDT
jgi:antitoxin (DNA-binding transcriptional repressor) of toxin-antitoxin stability system